MLLNNRKEFPALTGLRAVAASMVFLFHYLHELPLPADTVVFGIFKEFHTGVLVFFVLSGFLITYHYDSDNDAGKTKYRPYLLQRLLRIYPLYLLLLCLMYLHEGPPDFIRTFTNVTLLKTFFRYLSLSGIPQSWSLTFELVFYAGAPFLFVAIKRFGYVRFYIAVFVFGIALTAFGILLKKLEMNHYGFFESLYFFAWGTVFGRFTEFFAGVLLAHYIQGRFLFKLPELRSFSYTTLGALGFFICLYLIRSFTDSQIQVGIATKPGLFVHNFILPFTVALFMYGLITEKTVIRKFLSSRVLVLAGAASYV
ncbi:MAG: acyltransferase, partial [Hymenobacteraceae bacterium]|nr:acyltransferase [Hymenobacteraceae bacterium]MDX5395255.1 acyltransferase [Hymenobacteraceae bacterium]MDX5511293.1 acyltransferase [Hymenobacteraceae bacterium]